MTRYARGLALIIAAGTAVFAAAQKPTTRPASAAPGPLPGPWANKFFLPGIEKDPGQVAPPAVVHDFGTVPHGTLCTHKLSVTNIYGVPIQVTDIRVECGCLKAYPPNKVLLPNEQAEFVVTMNAGAFKGLNSKKMQVAFGPNFVSVAVLRFVATSREDVTLTPGEVDFGIISQGSKPSKTVVLKYNGRQGDWKLDAIASASPAFDVEVKEASRGALLGVEYYIVVSMKSDAPAGSINDSIAIKTNDPAVPVVNVNVRAAILAPVRASPDKLDFKDVKVGEAVTFKVIVKPSASCTLTALTEDADGFSLETSATASNLHIVTVKFEPKKAGVFRKEFKIQSNLPGNPSALVVVDATSK